MRPQPDGVILLERRALGRRWSSCGWRSMRRRSLRAFRAKFDAAGVPLRAFNSARSELHTFDEVRAFMEELGGLKLAAQSDAILERWRCEDHAELHNGLASRAEARAAAAANLESKVSDEREANVEAFCKMDEEEEGACLVRRLGVALVGWVSEEMEHLAARVWHELLARAAEGAAGTAPHARRGVGGFAHARGSRADERAGGGWVV
ncbi:hypothetical protein AB1Y20_014464 [Prymnesium parvum]|uniref:Uncharacterized protein n=1 Tax=Prymnesium parvum TaxID=97485 RepID=A0AB34IHA8_PRYPA